MEGRKPNVKYFSVFANICYILTDREQSYEFDPKNDEGIFHVYSINITMYRVFKMCIKYMMESIYVIINWARYST